MSNEQDTPAVRHVDTPSGRIGYVEVGSGPVALFVHGVLLNKHMWRYQLGALSDFRRCIAVDLLAHGDTEIAAAQDVSVTANAKMLKEVLDALHSRPYRRIGRSACWCCPAETDPSGGRWPPSVRHHRNPPSSRSGRPRGTVREHRRFPRSPALDAAMSDETHQAYRRRCSDQPSKPDRQTP
ncbi:hypothetical protein SAMN05444321_3746 [Bradyrhizobium lablabi]|nr:hypothetical protein SAMN05444321_3746 [Bradyrhizobium lablabi]